MAFCIKCGVQLTAGANFCAGCGTPVQSAPAAPPAIKKELTKEELAKIFMDGIRAKHAGDYAKAYKLLTEYLSLVNTPDEMATAYGSRGDVLMEGGQFNAAVIDWKKAVDLGADVYEDILREHNIVYKPQK